MSGIKGRYCAHWLLISVLIITLSLSAVAGTVFYCNGELGYKNSRIASLNDKVSSLKNQINDLNKQVLYDQVQVENLQSQVANLTSANVETALGVTEVPYDSPHNMPSPMRYSHLHITGYVNNTGRATAYNVELMIVAEANRTVLLNMSVPLSGGVFGTNAQIDSYLANYYSISSVQPSILYSGQTVEVCIDIFHEGVFSDCSYVITPVWENSP